MTDKQIVAAYLARMLSNASCAPDEEEMRQVSETDLSKQRCVRIGELIANECERPSKRKQGTQNRGKDSEHAGRA
jgi:hypothetical protein